ncbi:MAG TPA: pitrilysin family protein [candidate division Zixibacteria bacterium]
MFKTLNRLALSLLLLLFLTQIGSAQVHFDVQKFTLDNGLTLLVAEDHSAPVASFSIWYKVGSKYERPGITGISHMCEHMMFKGTRKVRPEEFSKIVQANGGIVNAWTSFDNTTYWEKVSGDKLELVMSLEADRLKNLKLANEDFQPERNVIAEERRQTLDDQPFDAVFEQLLNHTFVAHPYHWIVIGFMSDIQSWTFDQLKNHFKTYYVPNNAVAVVAGDIKAEDALKLTKKYFGKIKAGPAPTKVTEIEPEQLGERRIEVHKIAQLPGLAVSYKVPKLGDPDSYPFEVAAKILFSGQSSRVYKKMVYDEQMALFVDGGAWILQDAGVFYAFVGMQPGRDLKEGEKALFAEIDRLCTEPVSEKELQKAKNQLESEFVFGLQGADNKGFQIGHYEAIYGDYKLLFEIGEKYQAVTVEDVMRVAKKYLDPRKRTIALLIPEAPPTAMTEQR